MAKIKGCSPHKRAPRPTFGVERGTVCLLGGDTDINTLDRIRVQQVIAVTGVSPRLAHVIAPMAFGGAAW